MTQIFRAFAVALLLAVAGPVWALGLGALEKDSALNERFEGRIPLLSVTADELNTLKVGLADSAAFKRAGIDFAGVLHDLDFELVEPESGPDYIQITSSQPIREPFLNFLVELNWASGRIYREYTVLLDPPRYDPQRSRMAESAAGPAPAQESAGTAPSQYEHQVNYPDDTAARPGPTYSGGDYGPVQSGETLWSIAEEMKPATATTHQMMLALMRANPDAFIGNNINALKRGAVLRMPESAQVNALSQAEALAQVKNQNSLWQEASRAVASEPAERADSTTPAPAPDATSGREAATGDAGGETESRLELVGEAEGATGQTGDAEGTGDVSEKLAVANEKLESLSQENAELKDRLAENEALIKDLKRLIALKDDELASLQDRTAEEAAGAGSPDTPQMVAGVDYPNGDPGQFIREAPDSGELLPGPVPTEEAVSHTVNYPGGGPGEGPGGGPETDPAESEPAAEAEPETEPEPTTTPAEPAPAQPDAPAASDGIMATVMGYVATARGFLLNNLIVVGGGLLAVILLLAGAVFMRRRQERIEAQADAIVASGTFPDFKTDSDLDQTSFEADAESATEVNAAAGGGEAEAATQLPDEEGDDLFVVPQGEAAPPQAESDEEEEDPLAEVNVLMAYEHFDQAEAFVRNALKSEPENIEYHAKLLEVFYAAGNKKKYEEAASDLRDLTGGKGEHWSMAVAMWQELSPNRALFEGGEDEDELTESTGSGGIVDITGDTAGGGDDQAGESSGGALDFDLGDSTGGGGADSGDEMLDLTASEEDTGSDEMLDLTASGESDEDDDVLDLTAASSSEDAAEQTQSLGQSASADDDNALDISFGESSDDSDLLDVTGGGDMEADDDLLDVTSSGQAGQAADEDDGSLDFSLDMDTDTGSRGADVDPEARTAQGSSSTDDDDYMLEFDSDLSLDSGESDSEASTAAATTGGEDDHSMDWDADGLDLEIQDDSADTGSLDEIGAELDRLEQTLGTLSRQESQDATKGFGSDTSDALEGIDSALEDIEPAPATGSDDGAVVAEHGDQADAAADFDISLGGTEAGGDGGEQSGELDISLTGTEAADESAESDDFSDFSLELDSGENENLSLESGGDDDDGISPELSEISMDLDAEEDSSASTSDDDISAELSELSKDLDSGSLELGDEATTSLDTGGNDDDLSLGFEHDSTGSASEGDLEIDLDEGSSASDTTSAGSADDGSDTSFDGGLDLDLSYDDMSSTESIDMDSTVELPKDKLSPDASLESDEDGDSGEDQTVFVGRSDDTEGQSLEDELTTKLDLAKAYVELGDSDSARGILEEVIRDGSEDQKRQAGELLQQL